MPFRKEKTDTDKYPLVSIILVSLNSLKTIELALQSIFSLDYTNLELIIVDGNSMDGTEIVLEKFREKIDRLIVEKDNGIYDAMNKGIQVAKGEFIYFTGADDIILCGWSNLARKLKGENIIFYGNSYFPLTNKVYNGEFNTIKLLFRNICHQSIFYPAAVFKKYEFSTRYPFLADYHLNLLLNSDPDFRFRHIDILVSVFSETGNSTLNKDIAFQNDRPEIIRKNYPYIFYIIFLTIMAVRNWFRLPL